MDAFLNQEPMPTLNQLYKQCTKQVNGKKIKFCDFVTLYNQWRTMYPNADWHFFREMISDDFRNAQPENVTWDTPVIADPPDMARCIVRKKQDHTSTVVMVGAAIIVIAIVYSWKEKA